ncbi:MAG: spore germination protein [Tepidanaerobacteraceae bacterium]|nr:spore germination protein [Tepidanaerobacteraceae bacterium]
MNPKQILICFIIFATLFVSGCWDRRELNEIGLVVGVGIDSAEKNNILLSTEVVLPSNIKTTGHTGGGGSKGKPYTTFSATAETTFYAVRKILDFTSRKLFYGYNSIIIISEEASKKYNMDELLDFFVRDPEFRERNWVLITPHSAFDILNTDHPLEMLPSKAIADEIKANTYKSKTISNDLLHVYQTLQTRGQDIALPVVKKDKNNRPYITGSAAFKSGKFAGYFNEIESRGVLWVLGRVKSGVVVIPWQDDESKSKISVEIIKASSTIEPFISNGKIGINVTVNQTGNIASMFSKPDLQKPDIIKNVETLEEKVIKREIEASLIAAKRFHSDVFGFGNHIHYKFPELWKSIEGKWRDEIFTELPVNVKVNCRINQVGLLLR